MEPLTKNALFSASKLLFKAHSGCFNRSTNISFSKACFSTSYVRAQGLEGRAEHEGATTDHTGNDVVYGGYKQRSGRDQDDHNIDNMSRATGFVADTARHGALGATKVVENMGDLAKETMDKAWDSAKNTTQNVQDTLVAAADENVVDTTEYRTIEDLKK